MTIDELLEKTAGNDGIASEATAKKILKALEDPGSSGRSARDTEEQSKNVSKASRIFSKVVKATGAGFTTLQGGSDKLVEGLGNLAASSKGLNKAFLQITATLAARVFENVDVFRNLAEIGANTSANLNDFRFVAATAGIDMTRLAQSLISTNTALTGLGGDAAKGARVFNQVMASLTKSDFTDRVVALGFSMGDITEGFADYVTMQTKLGRSQSMNTSELISGSQEYLLRLDQLSRLTGLQRDQVKDELQAVADARELRLISNKEIEATMVRVKAAAPEMVNAVTGLLAKGFPEGGEQVGIFAVEGVREAVTALRNNVPGASDMFIQALARNGERISQMDESQKRLIATQLGVGNEFFNIAADSIRFRQFLGQSTEAIIREQEEREKNSEGARKYDIVTEQLRSSVQGLFTPFQKMTDMMLGMLVPVIESTSKAIGKIAKQFNDWFNSFDKETQETITKVTGFGMAVASAGAALYTAIKVKSGVSKIGSYLTGGGGGGASGGAKNVLTKTGAGGGGMLAGMGGGLKGLASGLTAMANPATLLGAANLGLAITAIGAGLAAATFLMGGALGKFADGLKGFGDIDGGNLIQVAKGTLALSGAMVAMGAGSVTGAVTGFVGKIFGGGSENFAKNLNKTLDELDKAKIDMYANSLENLGNAMTNLRGGMTGTMTTTASATGDKLDQLNNTMEQILMAIADSNRYNRITSQATVETAENFG